MILSWTEEAWEDYLWWQAHDKKILKRVNSLIKDIARNGNDGIRKPEPLKFELAGFWSRRITEEHRLIYRIKGATIEIAGCRYHY